jgi:hypothetical protein
MFGARVLDASSAICIQCNIKTLCKSMDGLICSIIAGRKIMDNLLQNSNLLGCVPACAEIDAVIPGRTVTGLKKSVLVKAVAIMQSGLCTCAWRM